MEGRGGYKTIIALYVRARDNEKINRVGRGQIKIELGWTEARRFKWYLVFLYYSGGGMLLVKIWIYGVAE